MSASFQLLPNDGVAVVPMALPYEGDFDFKSLRSGFLNHLGKQGRRSSSVGGGAHKKPRHPRDLVDHVCLNWRRTAEALPYKWEFTEPDGREIAVAVGGRVLSTDSVINLALARAGVGLTIVYEDMVREDLANGVLTPVLKEFLTPFPGYYLFYSQRRHVSPALRGFIEHIRALRQSPRRRKHAVISRETS